MGAKYPDRLRYERRLWAAGLTRIAGVDEAGRGPLAGPVVAAAVVLPAKWARTGIDPALRELTDSKQLSPAQREKFFELLTGHPHIRYGLGVVEAEVIDQINILQATHRAMRLALAQLDPTPDHVLVDGRPVPALGWPQTALVGGDARCYSVAAASVLAKVTRDRLMQRYDQLYPAYGFAQHKGYGTPQHLAALAQFGPCPIHRRSFAPMRPVTGELFCPGVGTEQPTR